MLLPSEIDWSAVLKAPYPRDLAYYSERHARRLRAKWREERERLAKAADRKAKGNRPRSGRLL